MASGGLNQARVSLCQELLSKWRRLIPFCRRMQVSLMEYWFPANCPKINESRSEENEDVKPPLDDKDDTEEDISQNGPPTAAANKEIHRPERFRDETHEDSMVNSASPDTRALLKDMKARTGVEWIDSSESFIMSGTFKQVEEAHTFLQENASLTSQSYLEHEGVEIKREQEQFMVEDSHDYSSGVKTTSNRLETFLLGK